MIPKLFDDLDDLKLLFVQELVRLVYREFQFSFFQDRFYFQECVNQAMVFQGTFVQFLYKCLLPEDKGLCAKLYFYYLLQCEQGGLEKNRVENSVDFLQFSEQKRNHFFEEVYFGENFRLIQTHQYFGFCLKDQNCRKKIALINNNFEKHHNVFFFNMGFQVEIQKYFSPLEMMDVQIRSCCDLLCYLNYFSIVPLFINDLVPLLRFLKLHKVFLKNSQVLTQLMLLLRNNFLKSKAFFSLHHSKLTEILVELDYFEDRLLLAFFERALSQTAFRNTYQWREGLRDFLKTHFDYLDYLSLKQLLNN